MSEEVELQTLLTKLLIDDLERYVDDAKKLNLSVIIKYDN